MKKLGLAFKEASEGRIKDTLAKSTSVLVVKYSGLSSPDLTSLRQSLKSQEALFFVVKNSVAKRALSNSGKEFLVKSVEGPCGLIFVNEEPVTVSRIMCNFLKAHGELKIEGGFIKDKFIGKKDIEFMAGLPSKEILRAKAVLALNSPISSLVMSLNQILAKFVHCLNQIKNRGSFAK